MFASVRGEFVGVVTEDGFTEAVAAVRSEKYSGHARGSHIYAGTAPTAATSPTADETTTAISPGATVTGVVNTAGDVDVFNINLVAGQTYSISLAGSGGSALIDPYVWLRQAGVEVARDDDGGQGIDSLLTFKATTSGSYQIQAGAYPDSGLTGGYTLTVLQMGTDSVASTLDSATAIAGDSTTHGFVESSGDVDMYAVTLQAGLY